MRERNDPPVQVQQLARAQGGVLAREQAMAFGVSREAIRRLVRGGIWGVLDPGLYLVPDVEPSWLARVWAGLLIGGPDSRAGGRTAAALQELDIEQRLPLDILVPNGVKRAPREWVVFRQERDGVRSISSRTEPPCTRVEDTVLDLCAVGTQAAAINWITTAVQRRLTTPDKLTEALQRRTRMPHRKLITGIVADAADGVQSALEHRYRHDVELAHGLPKGNRQKHRAARSEFIDVVYEEYALVVELDGRIGHVGRLRDRRRDNVHTKTGSPSLRYGWHEVTQEMCAVALEVADVLVECGWAGYLTCCPNCLV